MIRGLEDPEIQLDLLGDKNQDMTFEEVLRFIEANEAGKRSASRLIDTHGAEAAKSSYNRNKRMERIQHEPKAGTSPCTFCGKKGQPPPRTFAVLIVPHTTLLALPAIRNTTYQQSAGEKPSPTG